MTDNNMILLNDTDKCDGTYTWSRGEQKSAIDFVLVNHLAYNLWCNGCDEKQELFDLTDHHLIEVHLKIQNEHSNYQRNGESEEKDYYKLDDESLKVYLRS